MVAIAPGDLVLMDSDGVLIIPAKTADEVIDLAEELARKEDALKQSSRSQTAEVRAKAPAERMSHMVWLRTNAFQNSRRLSQELLPLIGQPKRARGPFEETYTVSILERLYPSSDHGRRNPQASCTSAKLPARATDTKIASSRISLTRYIPAIHKLTFNYCTKRCAFHT